jgi:hypothetical protein
MTIKNLLHIAVMALAMAVFQQQSFAAESDTQADPASVAEVITGEAAPEEAMPETAVPDTEPMTVESVDTENAVAESSEAATDEPEKVSIMDTPLDGSSIEAFEAGLEEVRLNASLADYEQLKRSMEYLLVFDLSAKRDIETLYSNLDGKTPVEIIDMPLYGRR